MQYEGVVYRPPSEANSLILQATIGCAHNRCAFCNMYREKRFRIRKPEEIKKDIDWAEQHYPPEEIRSIFLADGNTILMKTPQLIELLQYAYRKFPYLQRATVYGASQYLARKSPQDFQDLRNAGLTRLHCGMESGSDSVLRRVNKGGTRATHIKGGLLVRNAGIELSMYYMPGLGGLDMWEEHAGESAGVLNEVNPDFIRLRTFIPIAGTPMADDYLAGKFKLMNALQVIAEIRLLIAGLEGINSLLLSDHWSNFLSLHGQMPQEKANLLRAADEALTMPLSAFRDIGMTHGTL
ncbi:MAG: radical SAM protein [Desulfarculales bacterium]|jgi:radical SAM superfamily enzyme YgiQ (UPF0313 family)|nr:radical SAM protein [Desulfarculales bacterium]